MFDESATEALLPEEEAPESPANTAGELADLAAKVEEEAEADETASVPEDEQISTE